MDNNSVISRATKSGFTTLSKTKYLLGARCPKALQFSIRHPEYSENYGKVEDYSELDVAYELSKQYYPGCVTVNCDEGFKNALAETQERIETANKEEE